VSDIVGREGHGDTLFEKYLQKRKTRLKEDVVNILFDVWDSYKSGGFSGRISSMFTEYFPKASPFYSTFGYLTREEGVAKLKAIENEFNVIKWRYFHIKHLK
jgi:hypothetical protein